MWLRWVLAPVFYGAGAWASSRREPAFVPLVSGLPRCEAYAKIGRRRHILSSYALTTPRLRIVSPRSNVSIDRLNIATVRRVNNFQLLGHTQETEDKVEQSLVDEGDDGESRVHHELEPVAFTILRRLAGVTSRNRPDSLEGVSPAECSNSKRDESRRRRMSRGLPSCDAVDTLQEVGTGTSDTSDTSPRSWWAWLPWWGRLRESMPSPIAAETTPCMPNDQKERQFESDSPELESNDRRVPQKMVEPPPSRPTSTVEVGAPDRLLTLSKAALHWSWGGLDENPSRLQQERENGVRQKAGECSQGVERSRMQPEGNGDAGQSYLGVKSSPATGSSSPSSARSPSSWLPRWVDTAKTKRDLGDIRETSKAEILRDSSYISRDDAPEESSGSQATMSRQSASGTSNVKPSTVPPHASVRRSRIRARIRAVCEQPPLLSKVRRPFRWATRAIAGRVATSSASTPSSVTTRGNPPSDLPREPEERTVDVGTLPTEYPSLDAVPSPLELTTPAPPLSGMSTPLKAAGIPFSAIRRWSRAAVVALAVRSFASTGASDDDPVESDTYPKSTVDPFPLHPAALLLRQRLNNYPFFPARAPRRPPGYRWLVSRISTERYRQIIKEAAADRKDRKNSSSSAPVASEGDDGTLGLDSRRMLALNALSQVTALVVNRLSRRSKQSVPETNVVLPSPESELTPPETSDLLQEKPLQELEKPAMERIEKSDNDADSSTLPAMPWWQCGVVAAVSIGLSLGRQVANRLEGLSSVPSLESSDELEIAEPEELGGQQQASSNSSGLYDVVRPNQADAAPAKAGVVDSATPTRLRDKPRVKALAKKMATTSRRLKLWLLLRRSSTARAEPLLPGVETAISTLPVPLASSEGGAKQGKEMEDDAAATAAAAPANGTVEGSTAAAVGAMDKEKSNKVLAPQAVDGGAWNMFGFFPTKDEDVANSLAETREVSPTLESTNTSGDGGKGPVGWPMPMRLDGNNPEAEVEAGLLQALRAAFGYRASDSDDRVDEAAETPLPSAEAVPPRPSTPLPDAVDVASRDQADEIEDSDSMSLTSRYLDDLSPNKEEDSRWLGAEAAAAAAGAAAGAAAEAAAAAAATMAVAAESLTFGGGRDDSDGGWQVSGRWGKRSEDEDDDVEGFGERPLNVKPKEVDPLKAQGMVLDPFSSAGLKRSVASQEPQGQRRRGIGILAAAISLARLPLPWKAMAADETQTAPTSNDGRARGIQDGALRRLGRVGVEQIASSMLLVSSEIALQVNSVEELAQFREAGGMPKLLMALSPKPYTTKAIGIAAIRNLLQVSPESVTAEILETCGSEGLGELRRLIGAPGEPWSAAAASAAAAAMDSLDAMRLQDEAVQLLQDLSMTSDEALGLIRDLPDLLPALKAIACPGTGPLGRIRGKLRRALAGTGFTAALGVGDWLEGTHGTEAPTSTAAVSAASKLLSMLGAHEWRPRQPGQRGLRILTLDGGGTRGVMTIAILREVLKGVNKDVHELFDIICGTSTGGILAMLFSEGKKSIEEASDMYDSLIVRIFRKDILGNAKLVLIQVCEFGEVVAMKPTGVYHATRI